MIPCLYASMETKFDNNGIGKLADAQSCIVTEKRNGSFELEKLGSGTHYTDIRELNGLTSNAIRIGMKLLLP